MGSSTASGRSMIDTIKKSQQIADEANRRLNNSLSLTLPQMVRYSLNELRSKDIAPYIFNIIASHHGERILKLETRGVPQGLTLGSTLRNL